MTIAITAVAAGFKFKEVAGNNGAIANSLTLKITGGTFAGKNGDLVDAVITNVPAGLEALLVKTSATSARLTLTKTATTHTNAVDVSDLTVTFDDSNFATGGTAPTPITNLAIDFDDAAAAKTLSLVPPNGAGTSEIYKASTLPTITGTLPDGVPKIYIYNNGGTKSIGEAVITGNTWSYKLPTDKLKDGVYNLTASASADGSGAMTAGFVFTVDTKAPAAPSVNAIKGAISDSMPVLSGKAEKGAKVEVFADAAKTKSLGVTFADAKGIWTLAVASDNTNLVADGTYKIGAKATDAAGNTSETKKDVDLIIDTTILTPTLTTVIQKNTVALSGKVEGETGGTLQLYGGVDGSVALGKEIKIGKDGTWKSSVKLADGNHLLSVVATDAAGNISDSSEVKNTLIDTSTATPTLELVKTGDVLTGFKGTAEALAKVKITVGKTTLEKTADSAGNWEVTDISTIPAVTKDTKLKITAIATDEAKNVSKASAAVEYTFKAPAKDTTAPTFVSATTSADGTKVVLTYSEDLGGTAPLAAAFKVNVAGTDQAVPSAVAVSGKTVTLTLAATVTAGQEVKVGYTAPAALPAATNAAIQDAAGNDAADLPLTVSPNAPVVLTLTPKTIDTYSIAADTIQLSKTVFTALGAVGTLAAGDFVSAADATELTGGTVLASTNVQDIIYLSGTGELYYNADGATAGGLTLIGTFSTKPALVFSEFAIVA